MPTPIAMPRLGMTMTEGMVVDWPVPLGTQVERGETVLVIESDKSEVEVEATGSGVLRHIYVEADETVPCGTLLAVLVEDGEDFDAEAYHASWQREQPAATAGAEPTSPPTAGSVAAPARRAGRGAAPATPAARKLARERGVDLARVQGSGPGGRITREDVEAQAAAASVPRFRVAEGVELDVPSLGTGDPLLLLPGFGTDVSVFSAQIPALAERFETRGVNPRGVAGSDAPTAERYDIATLAADVGALIQAPAHLVAASLGTAVALELALAQPEKVRSLSLLTPLVEVDPRLDAVSRMWCRLAADATSQALAEALLPWFFSPATLADEKRSGQILRGLANTLSRASAPALERTRAGMQAWSGSRKAELAGLAIPTLVVVAGGDLLTPDGEAIAKAIPAARLEQIAGAGHAVALEAPETVTRAILEHLASCD